MVSARFDDSPGSGFHTLDLKVGQKKYQLTLEGALALAHGLIKNKQYAAASRVCERVAGRNGDDRHAAVLLACCKAGMKDYAGSNDLLHAEFSGRRKELADRLQAALVYHTLGLPADCAEELAAVVEEDPDLPIVWLLLADQWALLGNHQKAVMCWRLAIEHDREGGPAALAARRELAHFGKRVRQAAGLRRGGPP